VTRLCLLLASSLLLWASVARAEEPPPPLEVEPPPSGFLPNGEPAPASSPRPPAPFSGQVLEKGTRDPVSGVRVIFTPVPPGPPAPKPAPKPAPPGTTKEPPAAPAAEVTTDEKGRFEVPDLAPGTYAVTLRSPLLAPSEARETLAADRRKTVTYYASRRSRGFEAVVRAEPLRREVSEQVLDANELKRIPGTQNDPIKAVQNLPGVARAPFGGGQLVVWGSAPGDTRVYADGVFIPRIFHFGGLRATLNAEFVTELSFKPGAYDAAFGRGLGGLIDVHTRSPRSDRVHGSVTLDIIDGSVTLEGAITKKLHAAAGARVSWVAPFIRLFNTSNFQISPFYWDYQLALRYAATPRDDVNVLIFGSTDDLGVTVENPDPATSGSVDTHTYFSRALVRWTHRFSKDTSLYVMPSIGADTTRLDTGDGGVGGVALKIDTLTLGYNLRSELRHRLAPFVQVFAGVDFEGRRASFDTIAPQTGGFGGGGGGGSAGAAALGSVQDQNVLHIVSTAPYAIARFEFFSRRLILSPQLRWDLTYIRSYEGAVSRTLNVFEPRLFLSYQAVPRWLLLKFGVGIFSQPATPQQLSAFFGNPNLELAYGATYVAGFEMEPTATLSIQGQFFYKDLRTLVISDRTDRYLSDGLGRVIGGDFLLRQRLWRGLFGWVAYTISRSERKETPETPWHVFAFDQTHILTLIASYKLPWERLGLEVGLRFRYVTGNPTTPIIGALRNTGTQNWTAIRGDEYSERLPDFHQLDLRIDKTWVFNRWKLGLYLDIQNLYNRANTETLVYGGRQLSQNAPIAGIPFFPNLGLRAEF
jgi:hypothetical protein